MAVMTIMPSSGVTDYSQLDPHIALTKAVSCGLGAHGVGKSVELEGLHENDFLPL